MYTQEQAARYDRLYRGKDFFYIEKKIDALDARGDVDAEAFREMMVADAIVAVSVGFPSFNFDLPILTDDVKAFFQRQAKKGKEFNEAAAYCALANRDKDKCLICLREVLRPGEPEVPPLSEMDFNIVDFLLE